MIANKGKYNPQNLAGYSNQGLQLWFTPFKKSLIIFMQNTPLANHVDRCKEQQFSHKGTTSFGNPASTLVFTGADLKEIQSGKFLYLGNSSKFTEVPHLSYEAGCCNFANPFQRKNEAAIGNSFKIMRHLFFN